MPEKIIDLFESTAPSLSKQLEAIRNAHSSTSSSYTKQIPLSSSQPAPVSSSASLRAFHVFSRSTHSHPPAAPLSPSLPLPSVSSLSSTVSLSLPQFYRCGLEWLTILAQESTVTK
ncbi:uncharacterized protein MONOS_5544 [Monocercomonoides exilis]|uniref:uncharacterized protein n=1 Tax=Monocercomonoides exilis TaxID=2049356 RepID=UPI00355A8559|nr:hypothetical protein MONOS_5544 [Monocercomonoides exilis]|eukprot:MONOS_5544.1-p1 / transcript=MONOS_5544.1 / gene=MONOS_5544 / organism=Monocercomonoides_exilis_PA203 / gene_product=unspecified product / transcript_product=unspecified product / location=Mono_scaffold00162:93028-93429(+) / protein_length=116 / sequence_SO=supercontig / SO=protein_coding / is_pseudo=false